MEEAERRGFWECAARNCIDSRSECRASSWVAVQNSRNGNPDSTDSLACCRLQLPCYRQGLCNLCTISLTALSAPFSCNTDGGSSQAVYPVSRGSPETPTTTVASGHAHHRR